MLHKKVIFQTGGLPGSLNSAGLDSAADSPRNHYSYGERDIFTLAAAYAYGITSNYPLNDGNKRMALLASLSSVEISGYRVVANEIEARQIALALADGVIGPKEFGAWLKDNCEEV